MTRQISVDEFCDCYEYWILFDTVEEASEYFNAASAN